MTLPLRLPIDTPAEVAAAAGVLRRHLDAVLRADRHAKCPKPMMRQDWWRVIHALRVAQALETQPTGRGA